MKMLNELVERLTQSQPVECARPEKTAKALKESIDRDYVHIMFKKTGTELGVQLDRRHCKLENAIWDSPGPSGDIHLVGGLILNYDKVRCVADLNVATCEGDGYLEPLSDDDYENVMGRSH